MSEATTHQILCNACKVAPEPVPDSEPEAWRCPACGVHDTRENVVGEAKQHGIEVVSRRLQNKMRDVSRGSRLLTFSGKALPHRVYRFVSDLEG